MLNKINGFYKIFLKSEFFNVKILKYAIIIY